MLSARKLLAIALPLAFFVVVAGAYTRIADAGLGCPDWPGCFGKIVGIPSAADAAEYGAGDYDRKKSAIELAHRYIAALLGLLIFAAAFTGWRKKEREKTIATVLAVLVLAQALLGMLTVTEKLQPAVVVAHLLGGMLILALLASVIPARIPPPTPPIKDGGGVNFLIFLFTPPPSLMGGVGGGHPKKTLILGAIAITVLFLQIALGGWVSANYAGISCPDFPLCRGGWTPPTMDFSGFSPARELHQNPDGSPISDAALATIHWLHRLGAILVLITTTAFAAALWKNKNRPGAIALVSLLAIQIAIGIAAVLLRLPVTVALAHNAAAAMLVANTAALLALSRK